MDKQQKQNLVDTIQRCAHLLHKEGEDVIKIFENTRDLNKALVQPVDFPTFEPIAREPMGFSDALKAEVFEETGAKI